MACGAKTAWKSGRLLSSPASAWLSIALGASLWAAQRIKQTASSYFAFDRYTDNQQCRANSASNALNKWMQTHFRDDIVIHGFRHALRDRLRAVQCPSEMIDQIGGWSSGKIGESYGEGFKIEQILKQFKLISL